MTRAQLALFLLDLFASVVKLIESQGDSTKTDDALMSIAERTKAEQDRQKFGG